MVDTWMWGGIVRGESGRRVDHEGFLGVMNIDTTTSTTTLCNYTSRKGPTSSRTSILNRIPISGVACHISPGKRHISLLKCKYVH